MWSQITYRADGLNGWAAAVATSYTNAALSAALKYISIKIVFVIDRYGSAGENKKRR